MKLSTISRFALTCAAAACVALPLSAQAREGVQKTSIGNGIKCWQASVVQPDGSIRRQQVCGKYGV